MGAGDPNSGLHLAESLLVNFKKLILPIHTGEFSFLSLFIIFLILESIFLTRLIATWNTYLEIYYEAYF